jgi:Apea-like HEPN
MSEKGVSRQNLSALKPLARVFLEAFQAASIRTSEGLLKVLNSNAGYYYFDGAAVEMTDQIVATMDALIDKAIAVIGPKGASERTLELAAEDVGKDLVRGSFDLDAATNKLIEDFTEASTLSFEVILPNYLVDFTEGIRSVELGRVRAALTADVAADLSQREVPVILEEGSDLIRSRRESKIVLTFPKSCWVVNVSSARDHAQEEAKWLIDVATSLLRLAYQQVGPMFPMPGDIEPNPTLPWHLKDVSATIGKDSTTGRTHGIIKSYEIDRQLEPAITDPAFLTRANLIFDPPVGSVAGRIHNGLGWLTRGRQSDDRAERFLFTFTAIESLLSNSDKTAPITQTIARHAAVILTDDTAARQKIASSISGLYDFRSTVVHRGGRPVAWTQVKQVQSIAEHLFSRVIHRVNLLTPYTEFTKQLSVASYGSPWEPEKVPEANPSPAALTPSPSPP